MKRCPFLGGYCIKEDCALWFQEISKDGRLVMNMCGCSVAMTASYLMEMRPYVFGIDDMSIKIDLHGGDHE